MKKLLLALLAGLLVLAGILVVRTLQFPSRQPLASPADPIPVDAGALARRLAHGLTYRTISEAPHVVANPAAFDSLGAYLERAFPLVHDTLALERVNGYSRLYRWDGADPALQPILLMGHFDVVPVDPSTASDWTEPPFEGTMDETYVWGRGALDNKNNVFGILEAVERLIQDGYTPQRTLYLSFGHDEEVGGVRGASAVADTLAARGLRFEFVLDEGGLVTEGTFPGLEAPLALIGIAEKGYVSLELTVEDPGGHSSTPPPETAVTVLSKAIARLNEHPFPAAVRGPTHQMFEYIGPELPFIRRLVFANLWLFEPLVVAQLSSLRSGNALLRTTIAPTILEAGVKDNVLPTEARAVVNHRIVPGGSAGRVLAHVRTVIDDPRVAIQPVATQHPPSPVSRTDSDGFRLLCTTIAQFFPNVVSAPYLVLGGTDARYFHKLSDSVYRFSPVRGDADELKRIHGTNERIGIENYATAVQFYHRFILTSTSPTSSTREPNPL